MALLNFKKRDRGEWRHDNPFMPRQVTKRVGGVLKTRSKPILRHLADHVYTLAGFGCISAASFTFSFAIGLYVTGILLLVFEFKVSD